MTATDLAPAVIYGYQEPTYQHIPEGGIGSLVDVGVTWLEDHHIILLPWQKYVLKVWLTVTDENFSWVARSHALLLSRQNGKSTLLIAYLLLRFFLINSRDPAKPHMPNEYVYTSHNGGNARAMFERMKLIIETHPDLDALVHIKAGAGSESITITSGPNKGDVVRFFTRSPDAGRGSSNVVVIWDETQSISPASYSALSKTTRAAYHPVNIYVGTKPDEKVHFYDQFESLRDAGRSGTSQQITWLEWSPPNGHDPQTEINFGDPAVWQACNPTLGYYLDIEDIQAEWETSQNDNEEFTRESLSYWPNRPVIDPAATVQNNDLDLDAWVSGFVEDHPEGYEKASWTLAVSFGYRLENLTTVWGIMRLKDRVITLPDDSKSTHPSFYALPLHVGYGVQEALSEIRSIQQKFTVKNIVIDERDSQHVHNDLLASKLSFHSYKTQDVAAAFEFAQTTINHGLVFHPNTEMEVNGEDQGDSWLTGAEVRESGQYKSRFWYTTDYEFPISVIKALTLGLYGAKDQTLKPKSVGKFKRLSYH